MPSIGEIRSPGASTDRMMSDLHLPRLGRGVRLKYDPVRQTQMLLRPEGALALNSSATVVLELCDGKRTVQEIIAELEAKYESTDIADDIRDLLASLAELGVVVYADR
ncbi:MAG: pyrroloquinoline quinone biosynthesis peptide chaperone PqqD [Gemmatimonas sp.]|nr:pyrroloquinoline quinone biosynthesis peptide chaperone PqqD [Gemmatimonas sp.]